MSSTCQLCSTSSATHYETISSLDRRRLELVLPKIDANLIHSAVICSNCIDFISTTYSEDIDIKPTIVCQQIKTENSEGIEIGVTKYEDLDIKRDDLESQEVDHYKSPKCNTCNARVTLCTEGFSTESSLEQQKFISCNKKPIKSLKIQKTNYICDTCGCSKTNRRALRLHVRTHTGEKPHRCEECGKGFTQVSTLKTHKKIIHSTERSFICEYCSKSFCLKAHLTRHILDVHMKDKTEKNFVCNYCGNKYRTGGKLRNHTKWHIGDRKFNCDICNKAFISAQSVRLHRVTHFPAKDHKCELCGKGFHQKSNLKSHMKTHIKI